MTLYVRQNGTYQVVSRPYVRKTGVYAPGMDAYVRKSNVYQSVYHYDVTPPNPPEVTLQIIETYGAGAASASTLTGRYIKVGVRLPGSATDPNARLVRVLTNYAGAAASNHDGGTWTQTPDSTYPSEPWSEWRYNDYGPHQDTSVYAYKQWPPNATSATDIANDKDYYFTAWSLDAYGNWSAPLYASIHVPKASVDAANIIIKEARFQPNTSGSWRTSGPTLGYQSGKLIQSTYPRSRGLWIYGNQFTDSIGAQGTPTIRSAQIYIKREDDTGVANADVNAYWSSYVNVAALPAAGSATAANDHVKLGTLAKGQGKWFDVPAAWFPDMNTGLKSIGLDYKSYTRATAFPEDYSVMQQLADNLRNGEVHVVWQEKP